MLKNFTGHLGTFWRRLEQARTLDRSVLLVAPASSSQDDVRVFAIEQHWRISFATTLERAVDIRRMKTINVIIYDQDLSGLDWRQGLVRMINCAESALAIVLSYEADARMYRSVLECGGYAVAAKPVVRSNLIPLVNGALQLAEDMDLLCIGKHR
jgi:DNA-binding NtrC family response regulator